MKIISFNIHHCSQSKVDRLLSMNADVYILPELSENITLPTEYAMLWVGNGSNKTKGLGVIYNSKHNCKVFNWYNPVHEYALPFLCEDILILAMWPTKTTNNKSKPYPQIAIEILIDYLPLLKNNKVFICGDFNCYVGQSGEIESKYSIKQIFELLKQNGLYSLYHLINAENLGEESTPTFYFRFNNEKPFFIDYAFANFKIQSFEIAKWDKSMSDHCALITNL